jgi:DNA replication and repair protein RecF
MHLSRLHLVHFRNFTEKVLTDFDPYFTIIIGKNSVGKTNLLESIYTLSNTHGFREKSTTELIQMEEQRAYVKGVVQDQSHETQYTVSFSAGAATTTKSTAVNNIAKPVKEYLKRSFCTVLFQPEDLLLITGSPDKRRSYVDKILSKIDYSYYQAKTNYEQGVYKRNKLLESFSRMMTADDEDVITFWDEYLEKQSKVLQEKRNFLVEFFNQHPDIFEHTGFSFEYRPSKFSHEEALKRRSEELRYRRTLLGPQLDDFVLYKKQGNTKKQLSSFGSRSEQRLGVLWLKVGEVRFYEQEMNQKPIILMDDIFSELDHDNSKHILSVFSSYQSFLTTAHLDVISLIDFPHKKISLE